MLYEGAGRKRGAVTADADKNPRQPRLRRLCEINNRRNIGEVVAGKRDDIRAPAFEQSEIRSLVLGLQIDQPHRVAGAPRRLSDQLETQRLEPQEDP